MRSNARPIRGTSFLDFRLMRLRTSKAIPSEMPGIICTAVLRKCANSSPQKSRQKIQRKWLRASRRDCSAKYQSGSLRRCQLSEHERFEELASLAAIGELSPEEHEEFQRHKDTCPECREIVAETTSLATAAFLAGSPNNENEALKVERHRRLREGIAQRLPVSIGGLQVEPAPVVVPVSFVGRNKH